MKDPCSALALALALDLALAPALALALALALTRCARATRLYSYRPAAGSSCLGGYVRTPARLAP